jgi:hypothetical protein
MSNYVIYTTEDGTYIQEYESDEKLLDLFISNHSIKNSTSYIIIRKGEVYKTSEGITLRRLPSSAADYYAK